jgi:hypothetical protein
MTARFSSNARVTESGTRKVPLFLFGLAVSKVKPTLTRHF